MTPTEPILDEFSATPSTLEALRAHHGVRAVSEEEDGSAVSQLPGGVYGFTGAPGLSVTPLFGKRYFQAFEVHKLSDESEHLVGFMTPDDATALMESRPGAEVKLYPEPWEAATQLISVRPENVIPSRKGPSREHGNYLRLRLG